jgi:hypothetical protein
MRSHRVTDFPDLITGSDNEVGWLLPRNIDVESPAFRGAVQACQRFEGGNFETRQGPTGDPSKAGVPGVP